jgi:hypothetical protein
MPIRLLPNNFKLILEAVGALFSHFFSGNTTMSSVSDTVALASTCTLPVPVAESGQRHIAHGSELKRSAHLKTNDNYAVAPYQAMPVTGPVVSSKETRQTGLPVLEPDHTLSPEVSAYGSGLACRGGCNNCSGTEAARKANDFGLVARHLAGA